MAFNFGQAGGRISNSLAFKKIDHLPYTCQLRMKRNQIRDFNTGNISNDQKSSAL